MHAPRSKRSLYKLRLTAVLTCAQPLVVTLAFGFMFAAVVQRSGSTLGWCFRAAGFAFLVVVLRWLVVKSARCPLCGTSVMGGAGCVRHRKAKRMLGAHSLRVAVHILLRGQFTCPYCNESTAMLSPEQAKQFSAYRRKRRGSSPGMTERDIWMDL